MPIYSLPQVAFIFVYRISQTRTALITIVIVSPALIRFHDTTPDRTVHDSES